MVGFDDIDTRSAENRAKLEILVMTTGLGQMFGFRFKENFQYPYGVVSVQNFWRSFAVRIVDTEEFDVQEWIP